MTERKNVNMGEVANAGMCYDDSQTATRLLQKNFSPLCVRKYMIEGWPMWIGIISDANLNDLDQTVYSLIDKAKELGFINGSIQGSRNVCGYLNDELVKHYNKIKQGVTEGMIVLWSIDKLMISAAYGDFMCHNKCAQEFYFIVNTMPHV